MKRTLILLLTTLLLFAAGCGLSTEPAPDVDNSVPEEPRPPLAGEQVQIDDLFGSLIVTIPEGWEYKTVVGEDSKAILFGPVGEQGKISLVCSRKPSMVCGTGLETETKTFGDGTVVEISTYDHHGLWDFMDLGQEPGRLVAWTQEGVGSWWEEHGATAMEILLSARTDEKPGEN